MDLKTAKELFNKKFGTDRFRPSWEYRSLATDIREKGFKEFPDDADDYEIGAILKDFSCKHSDSDYGNYLYSYSKTKKRKEYTMNLAYNCRKKGMTYPEIKEVLESKYIGSTPGKSASTATISKMVREYTSENNLAEPEKPGKIELDYLIYKANYYNRKVASALTKIGLEIL